jgi:RimJ/RimL family protein N-acetyltransferase
VIGRAATVAAFGPLDIDTVVAFTEPHNQRSRAVMDRLGMTYEREFARSDRRFVLYRARRHR